MCVYSVSVRVEVMGVCVHMTGGKSRRMRSNKWYISHLLVGELVQVSPPVHRVVLGKSTVRVFKTTHGANYYSTIPKCN